MTDTQDKKVKLTSDHKAHDEALSRISPETAEILRGLPKEKREIVIQAIQQESFSGPLPHPQILQGYDDVQIGFAERIVAMAEKEQAHRFECDKGVLGSTRRGQWMGFGVALFFGGLAGLLGWLGDTITASIIGGLDIVALVTIFITGKNMPSK